MGKWNYRIIEKTHEDKKYYEIHEVYYDAKNKITAWSEEAIAPFGDELIELNMDLRYMSDAFKLPILKMTLIEGKETLIEDKTCDNQINNLHYFEFMDRASVVHNIFDETIAFHPVVKKEKSIKKIITKIGNLFGELYQKAGALYSQEK